MPKKASVIITAYEQHRELALILEALNLQTFRDFEVIIGDDGSGETTKQLIEAFRARARFPIKHLWHEHVGYRKCLALNSALYAAEGETVVFLDGDCVPHDHYVEQHVRLQEPGRYIAGRRIDLSKEFSEKLTPELVASGYLNGSPRFYWDLFWDSRREGGSGPLNRSYMVHTGWWRELTGLNRIPDMMGCNYSVPREALLRLNGFDERFEGYGREDTDIEVRLQRLGYKIKSAKNLCLQYHVWHERRIFGSNEKLVADVKQADHIEAIKGLRERFGGNP